jgi:hypothetical protein
MTKNDADEVTRSRPSTHDGPGDFTAPPSLTPASARRVMRPLTRPSPRPLPPWPGPIAGLFAVLLVAAAVMLGYVLVVALRAVLAGGTIR